MSEWTPRGYRKHHHQYENVYWCECDGRCSQGAVCDCCELADLRDEVERLTARAEAAEAERDALRGRIEAALDASALLRGYIDYDSQVAAWMTLESALRGEFPR